MRAHLTGLALLVLTIPSPAGAQVRDAAPAATGTGVISGVISSDTTPSRPLRRAVVTLNAQSPFVGKTAITDDAGRYVFEGLPPARYSLNANKRGWVGAAYGAKAIGRPGRSIQLAAGARVTAPIRLARSAVISGTVLDQNGQPISGIGIRVMRFSYTFNTGERRLTLTGGSISGPDDRGYYRISGLSPGEYYVAAQNNTGLLSAGRDLHLTTDVDVQEAMKAAQAGPGTPMTDVPQRSIGLGQVFYPGVASAMQATPITVRVGEERAGVDFTLQYTPMARVQGIVSTAAGPAPAGTQLTLVANEPSGWSTGGIEGIKSARASADGRFEFAEIAPGPYLLSARATVPQPAGTPGPPQILSAVTDLEVPGEDLRGVSLMLQEGFTVAGTIAFDGTTTPPSFSSVRVNLTPAQTGTSVSITTAGMTTTPDGHFTLNGVSPGRYRLTASLPAALGAQPTWTVRSTVVLGQNTMDTPVDIRQSVSDALITLTDRINELRGKVDAPGNDGPDYSIILFSADRAHWTPQSRRILSVRTASDGTFIFRNVPPGEYQIAAVDDVEPGEWYDPTFLSRLAPAAIKLTIAEGEKKVQDIRVGGG